MGNQLVIVNHSSHDVVVRTAEIPMTPARVLRHAKGEYRTSDITNGVTELRQTKYVTRITPGLYGAIPLTDQYLVLTINDKGYRATMPPTRIIYQNWATLMNGHIEIIDAESVSAPGGADSVPVMCRPLSLIPSQLLSYRMDTCVDTRVTPGPTIPLSPAIEPIDMARLLTAVGHGQVTLKEKEGRKQHKHKHTAQQQREKEEQEDKPQHEQQTTIDTDYAAGSFSPFGVPGHALKTMMVTPFL